MSDTQVVLENGKYTFVVRDSGLVECLRFDEPWVTFYEGGKPEDHVGNEEQLDVTCHDCGNHWVEVYRGNKCIEIILYDIKGDYVFE